jgi:hypothetical protein
MSFTNMRVKCFKGTIISNKKEDIMVNRRNEFEEEQGAWGSLHEHFIEGKCNFNIY